MNLLTGKYLKYNIIKERKKNNFFNPKVEFKYLNFFKITHKCGIIELNMKVDLIT